MQRLGRIGIGDAQRVAAAPVKGLFEMQDLSALLAVPLAQVAAHLPVEGDLHRVLDRERAALDEKIVRVRRRRRGARQGFDELGEVGGVKVGVCDL